MQQRRLGRSARSFLAMSGRSRPAWGRFEALEPRRLLSTFTVTNTDDDGSGSLRDAIFSANGSAGADIINFDESIHGQLIALTTGELAITDDLTINGLEQVVYATQSSRVIYNTATTTIRGLTITGGNGVGSVGSGNGGGIYNDSGASLTLADTAVTENAASNSGGGIYSASGASTLSLRESTSVFANTAGSSGGGIYSGTANAVRLIDSSVQTNFAASDGGGIYNGANGLVELTSSSITGNQAAGTGGGIASDGMLTIQDDSSISDNSAGNAGGGIYNQNLGNTVDLASSTISGNIAGTAGGGIFSQLGAEITISSATISGNSAGTSGGGIYNPRSGHLALNNSTIANNTAATHGGGIFNGGPDDPDPDVHLLSTFMEAFNSTFSGNAAGDSGGAIYNDYLGNYPLGTIGAVTIANSTIAANTAGVSGGGLYNFPDNDTFFVSTLVAGNTANGNAEDIMGRLSTGSENNLVQDADSAGELVSGQDGNIVGVDPLLASLDSNGGRTQTHALLADSPALGAGINPYSLTKDQRDGPFSRGTAVDIGAFQRQTLNLIVDTLTDDDNADFSPGDLSLREAIGAAGPNPGDDTVTFAPSLRGGTITLENSTLQITGDLSITGPGASLLTVSGDGFSTALDVAGDAVATISGLTITGGGIGGIANSGTLSLTDMTISGNSSPYSGGGIYNGGTLTVTRSTISGNSALMSAGGIVNDEGCILTIVDSTVSGNTSEVNAGGIANQGELTLVNTTISGNTASVQGGGLFNASGATLTLSNSTVTANSASGGGGLANAGDATVHSTILAGNSGGDLSGTVDSTSSLIGGDALLGPLADNGGPTFTHALLPGSPALGAGNNPLNLTTDQRGAGFGRTTSVWVDIGAFQGQSTEPGTLNLFGGASLDRQVTHDAAPASGINKFNRVEFSGGSFARTYRILNSGDGVLALTGITKRNNQTGDYAIAQPSDLILSPGESTTFTVTFEPTAFLVRRTKVVVGSNDATNAGEFFMRARGRGVPEPTLADIDVMTSGAAKAIADNSRFARLGTATKLGQTSVGSEVVRVFTITNTGTTQALTLTGSMISLSGAGAASFRLDLSALAASLAPGASTTFSLIADPTLAGRHAATVSIASNDLDEPVFDFKVSVIAV